MRVRGLLTLCGFFAGACSRPAPPVAPPPTIAASAPLPPRPAQEQGQAQQVPEGASVRSDSEPSDSEPPDDHPADGDPRLLERLTVSVPEPRALGETRFQAAREVFREVKRGLLDRSYVERKNASCEQALVSDQREVVRGFTQFGGTEHHYSETRHYFDQGGALRLLLYKRNDEAGGRSEDLVAFNPAGDIVGCKHVELHPGMAGPDLCEDEKPEPAVDPEVKRALQPSAHRPRNRLREYLQSLDPASEFGRCSE